LNHASGVILQYSNELKIGDLCIPEELTNKNITFPSNEPPGLNLGSYNP